MSSTLKMMKRTKLKKNGSECQEIFMRLEVDAKVFIESVEQCGSNDLAENGNLSKGKETVVCNEVLENEGISNMQSPTPSARDESHSSGMSNMQSVDQALPEISTEKSATLRDIINSVQTAGDKPK